MAWYFWLILACVINYYSSTISKKLNPPLALDVKTFDFNPSEKIKCLIAANKMIEAIKEIRSETRLGLKDSKDLYEYLAGKLNLNEKKH
ncbi:MAG: hypothetical protein COA79_14495 [Planctomycetota bacterium]|nr:MAG: hypothetical protein COA79_14495 [Planctomycetota bacterium]